MRMTSVVLEAEENSKKIVEIKFLQVQKQFYNSKLSPAVDDVVQDLVDQDE